MEANNTGAEWNEAKNHSKMQAGSLLQLKIFMLWSGWQKKKAYTTYF
jgi:hypothetical protein